MMAIKSINVGEPAVYQHASILDNTQQLVKTCLAPKVQAIDAGYYPQDEMAQLGKAGAFLGHLSAFGGRFDTSILATATIGEVCGTTAFLSWCHQVCGLYLDQCDNDTLKADLLPSHAIAKTFGGTALSNPMKTWAKIETLLLKAKKQGKRYLVSGVLPWISHIAPEQYCGAVAGGDDGRELFFLLRFDDARQKHWQLLPCPAFAGMEGSSTWRIVLDNYPIDDNDLLTDNCQAFIKKIRGAFVLMQLGMGAGIIQGAIGDIRSSSAPSNVFLTDTADSLSDELNRLSKQVLSLATTPFETDSDYFLDVLGVRMQGATLALKATQSALLHQGAKGYVMSAEPQRRVREAQFVAIVTPAIKHLRYLSHQIMADRHKL